MNELNAHGWSSIRQYRKQLEAMIAISFTAKPNLGTLGEDAQKQEPSEPLRLIPH